MILKGTISQIICVLAISLFTRISARHCSSPTYNQLMDTFYYDLARFSNGIYDLVAKDSPNKNIIISPLSIHQCLTMTYMGARGPTAYEMNRALSISMTKDLLARAYHDVLKKYQNSPSVQIANKVYVKESCGVKENFNRILTENFFSSIDHINFANNDAAAKTINTWVSSKTNNLINNLIPKDLLDSDTGLLLVSAIHFKGNWKYEFPKEETTIENFYVDDITTTKVKMMHLKEEFKYGEIPKLHANALEIPYKDSNLSMLIILPNKPAGLAYLENNIQKFSLSQITSELYYDTVQVHLPKFKVEFEAELSEPLKRMGMKKIFSDDAQLDNMLESCGDLQVSNVIHKAFIDVNEEGTEAAAATGAAFSDRMGDDSYHFIVDRPFHFIIKDDANIKLFEGTIKNINT